MRKAIDLVVLEGGGILLVRKKKTWILPGGKPKRSESHKRCLVREINEELGVRPFIIYFYKSFEGKTPYKGDILRAEIYRGKLLRRDGDLFIGDDGEGLHIRKGDSIGEFKFVTNPYDYNLSDITKQVIDSLIKDNYLEDGKK